MLIQGRLANIDPPEAEGWSREASKTFLSLVDNNRILYAMVLERSPVRKRSPPPPPPIVRHGARALAGEDPSSSLLPPIAAPHGRHGVAVWLRSGVAGFMGTATCTASNAAV